MVAVDLQGFLTAGAYGALGGVVYAIANNLFESADQYFSAVEHIGAGFVVGILAILVFGLAVPTSITDAIPFLTFGYASLDIIQLVAAKLNAAASGLGSSSGAGTAAGPPATPGK